jgi:superfamily II DNA/RNA helicase
MHVLHKKGFEVPTPIQAAVIPVVSKSRDVVGVAQTVRYHMLTSNLYTHI